MTEQHTCQCGTSVVVAANLRREADNARLHTADRCRAFRAANGQGSRG